MVKRTRTELPGGGESSEPQGSGARQGEPQHLPEQLQQKGRGAPQLNPQNQSPGGARFSPQQQGVRYQGHGGYDDGCGGSWGRMAPQQYPGKYTCQQQGRGGQPHPVSSKPSRLPLRPGRGSIGIPILVKANHFLADLPDKDLHQYDVSISPEVSSRGVNRAVIKQLVKVYGKSRLGERLPAYDGRKNLYTAGPLPFVRNEFKIVLTDDNDGLDSARTERGFKVDIKLASRVDLHHLEMFLKGNQADAPQKALQVLDTVLRELPTARYYPVGRSFYYPDSRQRLGEGLESWRGFFQSMRPTQMGLSLNVDLSSTVLVEPLPVIEFASQLLKRDILFRTLSDVDCAKIQNALEGVIVVVSHSAMRRRKYRIAGLTSQPTKELTFPDNETGLMMVVVEYFRKTYGVKLKHTQLPCLQVGTHQKPRYLPMEVCEIVRHKYLKRLNERQITEFLKGTCLRPRERESIIRQTVRHNAYADNPYAKEFGIKITDKLAPVEARILPAPWLKFHETGLETRCLPQVGQ